MTQITQKALFTTLIALTLASATLSQDCGNNCYQCYGKNQCNACYRRKQDQIYDICDVDKLNKKDHCLLYQGSRCIQCQPGYALEPEGNIKKCFTGTIPGCTDERNPGRGFGNYCNSCEGGYPNDGGSRCISSGVVKKPIARCQIGFRLIDGIACKQCEAGYTSDRKSCFKTPPAFKGCLLTDAQRKNCVICDLKNGYYSSAPGKCSNN